MRERDKERTGTHTASRFAHADGECAQEIAVPNTVWSLACTDRGDLVAGCGDRMAYLFTRDAARAASDSDREALEKALSAKSGGYVPVGPAAKAMLTRGSVCAAARRRSMWLRCPSGRTGRTTGPSRAASRCSTKRARRGPRGGTRRTRRGWRCAARPLGKGGPW